MLCCLPVGRDLERIFWLTGRFSHRSCACDVGGSAGRWSDPDDSLSLLRAVLGKERHKTKQEGVGNKPRRGEKRESPRLPCLVLAAAAHQTCGRSGSIPNQVTPSSWWSGRGRAHTSIPVLIIFAEPSPFFSPSFLFIATREHGVYNRGVCT